MLPLIHLRVSLAFPQNGFDNKAVAEEVGTSRQTVGKWRERFRTQGLILRAVADTTGVSKSSILARRSASPPS